MISSKRNIDFIIEQFIIKCKSKNVFDQNDAIKELGMALNIEKIEGKVSNKNQEIDYLNSERGEFIKNKLINVLVEISDFDNMVEGSESATVHKKNQKKSIGILRELFAKDSNYVEYNDLSDKEFMKRISKINK